MFRSCRSLSILILGLISGQLLHSQNYLWPTNASNFVSSSFCEFRDGHYHSGIDIKTWLREGFPCYAIADGYIERIRVSPFGYGKVLYLKLDDGNTAVYAHLQRFAGPVDTIIRRWQLEHQNYELDIPLDSIKFKKGEIVAYNGGTGAGPPHLHFEIRNQQGHPVNPLYYYPQYQDPLPPGLKSLICIPMTAGSRINGSYLPQKFSLMRSRDGRRYTVQKPIRIKGSVGLGIKGFDQAVELGNSFGFYQTVMIVNTDTVFNIRYDEFNFDQTAFIFTEIYYPQWIKTGEVFHKLYIDNNNPLRFYRRKQQEDGIITVEDTVSSVSILVKDIRSNLSLCQLELLPDPSTNVPRLTDIYRREDWIYLTLLADECREIFFKTGRSSSAFKAVKYFEILDGKISASAEGIKFKIQIDDSLNSLLKVTIRTSANHLQEQILSVRDNSMSNLKREPEFNFLGSDLVLRFHRLSTYGIVRSSSRNVDFPVYKINQDWSEVFLPGNSIAGENHRLEFYSSLSPAWSQDIDMHQLYPGISQSFCWFDSAIVITTSAESVLDTVLITADTISSASVQTSMPLASPVYQLRPASFPWYAEFLLQLRADRTGMPHWGKWAIYQIESSGKISYLPGKMDPAKLILSAPASSFGKFFIASDTLPPVLEIISPQNGQEYAKTPRIKLKLDDLHSGIGYEQNISLSMDGNYVIPEWDPEKKMINTVYDSPLSPGTHTFTVSVKDRCGNSSRQAVLFTIKKHLKK